MSVYRLFLVRDFYAFGFFHQTAPLDTTKPSFDFVFMELFKSSLNKGSRAGSADADSAVSLRSLAHCESGVSDTLLIHWQKFRQQYCIHFTETNENQRSP
jgi:hypothetical protein